MATMGLQRVAQGLNVELSPPTSTTIWAPNGSEVCKVYFVGMEGDPLQIAARLALCHALMIYGLFIIAK